MNIEKNKRRATLSWLFLGTLLVLCGILGVLQYRWIGEVSLAARDRLRGSLQGSLVRLSQDFNSEIAAAAAALAPAGSVTDAQEAESQLEARYEGWKQTTHHGQIFRRIAIAIPQKHALELRNLDLDQGVLASSEWPAAWSALKNRLDFNIAPRPWQGRGPPFRGAGPPSRSEGFAFEIPLFAPPSERTPPGLFRRREVAWLIFELNPDYVRDVMLPELMQRHLENGGSLDYQVAVVTRSNPGTIIYQSDPDRGQDITRSADASVGLFEPMFEPMFRRSPPGLRARGPGPGRGPGPDAGRWQMFARHRAGSLEAVVSQARWRNLAVTACVLLLMVATAAALIRYTRRAQKLAALQMDFVAGVSHELRTPLTVIHTAAYNLQGRVANSPSQVEQYGALIQKESARLRDLVEQVLQFASAEAGRVIQERQPLSVAAVIEEAMESSKRLIEGSRCVVEKSIDPGLPPILGDAMALRHALENLVGNAAKYASNGGNWIGISASQIKHDKHVSVEIRVSDHGPGIPEEEQEQIFDPFFRGARALQDQVHGTGLGLSLVKRIVEAHGGSIRVESAPMKGADFIVRLPAAAAGAAG